MKRFIRPVAAAMMICILSVAVPVYSEPEEMPDGVLFDSEYYADKYQDVVDVYQMIGLPPQDVGVLVGLLIHGHIGKDHAGDAAHGLRPGIGRAQWLHRTSLSKSRRPMGTDVGVGLGVGLGVKVGSGVGSGEAVGVGDGVKVGATVIVTACCAIGG